MTKLSIALQTNKPLNSYASIAKTVEDYGFDRISVYNDLLYQPAWPALYEMAGATTQIELGVAAVNPFTSHPVNIAGYTSLLQEKSQGRAYLGLARGAWLDLLGIHPNKPISAMRDALQLIHHLLDGKKEALESEFYPYRGGDRLRWELASKPPFLLGSWGLRTLQYCYPYVDQIKLGGSANPDLISHFSTAIEHIRAKISAKHTVKTVIGAVSVVDEDGDRARQLAKQEVALYLPVIASLDPTLKIKADLLDAIKEAANSFDYLSAAEFISDDLLQKFAFAGTPEDIILQSRELVDAGTYCIEFGTPHGVSPKIGMQLLGKAVLPEVKDYISSLQD